MPQAWQPHQVVGVALFPLLSRALRIESGRESRMESRTATRAGVVEVPGGRGGNGRTPGGRLPRLLVGCLPHPGRTVDPGVLRRRGAGRLPPPDNPIGWILCGVGLSFALGGSVEVLSSAGSETKLLGHVPAPEHTS
jgi:hypothetical protein